MNNRLSVIIILSLFLCIIGCELGVVDTSNNSFSPPNWIFGTWSDEDGDNIFEFTIDNIIFTTPSLTRNFKEDFGDPAVSTVTETISNSVYQVTISDTETSSFGTFRFEKISDDSIDYYMTISAGTFGPVEIIRQ